MPLRLSCVCLCACIDLSQLACFGKFEDYIESANLRGTFLLARNAYPRDVRVFENAPGSLVSNLVYKNTRTFASSGDANPDSSIWGPGVPQAV